MAALLPGAALPAALPIFLMMLHLPALRLPPRTSAAGIPPLLNLAHLAHLAPSANTTLAPHPHIQTSYSFSAHFVSSPSAPSPPSHVPGCFSLPPASSSPP